MSNMRLIIAHFRDGSSEILGSIPSDINTEDWLRQNVLNNVNLLGKWQELQHIEEQNYESVGEFAPMTGKETR